MCEDHFLVMRSIRIVDSCVSPIDFMAKDQTKTIRFIAFRIQSGQDRPHAQRLPGACARAMARNQVRFPRTCNFHPRCPQAFHRTPPALTGRAPALVSEVTTNWASIAFTRSHPSMRTTQQRAQDDSTQVASSRSWARTWW